VVENPHLSSELIKQQLAALGAKRVRIEANENPIERARQEDALYEEQVTLEALLVEAIAAAK
jgi:hypothetical protein